MFWAGVSVAFSGSEDERGVLGHVLAKECKLVVPAARGHLVSAYVYLYGEVGGNTQWGVGLTLERNECRN